jgi:hypothetical protein
MEARAQHEGRIAPAQISREKYSPFPFRHSGLHVPAEPGADPSTWPAFRNLEIASGGFFLMLCLKSQF